MVGKNSGDQRPALFRQRCQADAFVIRRGFPDDQALALQLIHQVGHAAAGHQDLLLQRVELQRTFMKKRFQYAELAGC